MIKGKTIATASSTTAPSSEYRKIIALNQSMLKVYESNPFQFYKEFVLKEEKKDKNSQAILIGSVVDFGLLECKGDMTKFEQELDKGFVMFHEVKGTSQQYTLADLIFDESVRHVDADGKITTSFLTRFTDAFTKAQADGLYKRKTLEWALEDFANSKANEYLKLRIQAVGKKVIDIRVIDKAKFIISQLMTDPFTRHIFNQEGTLTHVPIEWTYTTLFGNQIPCKQEVDHLTIDHEQKKVIISDLKCNYDNEMFDYSYLKYGYYIQNAFYRLGVREWLDKNGMCEYEIVDGMRFIVADTSGNNRRPLIYHTSMNDVEKGLNGFYINGLHYEGVYGLMEGVSWAMENGIYNITKQNFENNGIVPLNIRYDR